MTRSKRPVHADVAAVGMADGRTIAPGSNCFKKECYCSWISIKFWYQQFYDNSGCRKNHARAMDSMQASLESEQRVKAETLRIKKKLEGDINELEIALDHSNKANNEAQKSVKRYQVSFHTASIFGLIIMFRLYEESLSLTYYFPAK